LNASAAAAAGSRTAVWVAASRASGAREPDPDVRNPDFLAERLLGDPSAYDADIPLVPALGDRRKSSSSARVSIRAHIVSLTVSRARVFSRLTDRRC
jgi:hypothetical protein